MNKNEWIYKVIEAQKLCLVKEYKNKELEGEFYKENFANIILDRSDKQSELYQDVLVKDVTVKLTKAGQVGYNMGKVDDKNEIIYRNDNMLKDRMYEAQRTLIMEMEDYANSLKKSDKDIIVGATRPYTLVGYPNSKQTILKGLCDIDFVFIEAIIDGDVNWYIRLLYGFDKI